MDCDGREPATAISPDDRAHSFAAPALAVFGTGTPWLEGTAVALGAVLAVGVLGALLLAVGRRFQWWSTSEDLRIRRIFRVTFGGLFLSALTVPYLLARAPTVGIALLILVTVVSVPYLLPPRRRPRRSTGEHSEID